MRFTAFSNGVVGETMTGGSTPISDTVVFDHLTSQSFGTWLIKRSRDRAGIDALQLPPELCFFVRSTFTGFFRPFFMEI